jgi:hypothetical protein
MLFSCRDQGVVRIPYSVFHIPYPAIRNTQYAIRNTLYGLRGSRILYAAGRTVVFSALIPAPRDRLYDACVDGGDEIDRSVKILFGHA